MLFLNVLQDILQEHLIFLVLPLFSKVVNFLNNVIKCFFRYLRIHSHRIHRYNIFLLFGLIFELLNNRWIWFYIFESCFIFLKLFFKSDMFSHKSRIFLSSFMLLEFSFRFLISWFGLCEFIMIFLFDLLLSFHKCFVITDSLIECFGGQTTLNSQREASKTTKTRELKEVNFLIPLN